jgi:hypothetical protein
MSTPFTSPPILSHPVSPVTHPTADTLQTMFSPQTLAAERELRRASVRADLRAAKILQLLDIQDVTEEDIDTALDEE